MHHGLHLAASDLFGAAALGERRDRRDRLRIGLLLQDRLEVAVQPAELGGELLLRRGAAGGHALRRLRPQMAHEQPQQLTRLPFRYGGRRDARRIRGRHPARLELAERSGDLGADRGARRQVIHVGFDHRLFHPRSGA